MGPDVQRKQSNNIKRRVAQLRLELNDAMKNNSEDHVWSRLLSDIYAKSASSIVPGNVLLLGDGSSGKTSLVAVIARENETVKGNGLEYHYIECNSDMSDGSYAYMLGSTMGVIAPGESTRLSAWVLDGDTSFSPLLKYAISPDKLDKSIVILCASLTEPWNIIDSLRRWADVLEARMTALDENNKNEMSDARDRQTRFWQEYVEPLDSSSHSTSDGAKVPSMESADYVQLPLGDTVLEKNLAVPIIVAITKADMMLDVEKECDLVEAHMDFLQMHIRRFCLRYGAALVYTSVRDRRNIDNLHKYIMHRVYGFPFTQPANVIDRDAVFIPAGWDNVKKINILRDSIKVFDPDDNVNEHIRKPARLSRFERNGPEANIEDEQDFLKRLKEAVDTQASSSAGERMQPESPMPQRAARGVLTPSMSQATRAQSPKKTMPATRSSTTTKAAGSVNASNMGGERDTLQQFFHNLLQQKPGAQTVKKPSATEQRAPPAASIAMNGTNGANGETSAPDG